MTRITKDTVKRALYDDVDAQYTVACWFYENEILESAHFWVKRAAQQGHFAATLMLEKLIGTKTQVRKLK